MLIRRNLYSCLLIILQLLFSRQRLRLGTLRNTKLRIHFIPNAGKANPTDDRYSSTLFNFNTPYINPRFLTCLSHTRHLENRS